MTESSPLAVFNLDEMQFSPTTWLFEGGPRAAVDVSMFIVSTPPEGSVELHVHPYPEIFLLLEGRGRWTVGNETSELCENQMLVVPPQTPHGFRNIGRQPLLVVSVHKAATLQQTFLGPQPV